MKYIKKETIIYDCLAKQIELYGEDKSKFNVSIKLILKRL